MVSAMDGPSCIVVQSNSLAKGQHNCKEMHFDQYYFGLSQPWETNGNYLLHSYCWLLFYHRGAQLKNDACQENVHWELRRHTESALEPHAARGYMLCTPVLALGSECLCNNALLHIFIRNLPSNQPSGAVPATNCSYKSVSPHKAIMCAPWPLHGQLCDHIACVAHCLHIDWHVALAVQVVWLVRFGNLEGHMHSIDAA